MSEALRAPTENQILAALLPADYDRLAPQLTPVRLAHGQLLYHADDRIEQVYFPTNSMVSLVSQMADGGNVEVGVTGFEGMFGLSVILGVDNSPYETMVQIPDGAMRASAQAIKSEFWARRRAP